jgi:carbon-monoxide dehydrogenase large subunit
MQRGRGRTFCAVDGAMGGYQGSAAGIGKPVRRKEDFRLLTGRGSFSDDLILSRQAYATMVRSPHAHARIVAVDATSASAMPGVLAVLTGSDVSAEGLRPIPHRVELRKVPDIGLDNTDGSPLYAAPHMPLPADRVRFIGEAVAIVIAETLDAARDAAERVVTEYEALPCVVEATQAMKPDAPRVWEQARGNVHVDASVGDADATQAAFFRAAHVVRLNTWVQRVTGVPMEPRTALAEYDAATGRYTITVSGGFGGVLKPQLADVLKIPPESIRFVLRDAGGNFGTKNFTYPEYPLLLWAARKIGRPVKWTSERHEAFLSDHHGRDLAADVELALDANGKFLAIRGSLVSNVGAHTVSYVPLMKGTSILSNVYDLPAAHIRARAVGTHTSSTAPYRSAGRPEAIWIIERLIDLAARRCGFDRVELRRRNLIAADAFPYANALGLTYDSGDYAGAMHCALELGDWNGFAKRREAARSRGRLRGIGIANYVEVTGGFPRERVRIVVHHEGRVELEVGTLASGQGHETSFAQLLVEWLGVPFERIQVVQGDTDRIPVNGGSHSGRSMRLVSIVAGDACDALIDKAKRIAALMFEVEPARIVFENGRFIADSGRSADLFSIAQSAVQRNDLPDDLCGLLQAESDQVVRSGGYPYGCHVCEVEVDPETGHVDLVAYAAVDDVGRAVNPMIVEGQTHGAVVQGVGQALWEYAYYEPQSGQLLSASLLDYAVPRADQVPAIATKLSELPSPGNRLGLRPGGEGGTTGALAAVGNAVVDALAEFAIEHIEMPITSERIWRAIQAATAKLQPGSERDRS